ncbi:MAG: CBS domain-containing protein [Chitinispirillia bacterium]|nr:CBS domain-containing protein [Chitinispirillia bacterium]
MMEMEIKTTIGHLSGPGHTFEPDTKVSKIFMTMINNQAITDFTVVDGNRVVGFMPGTAFNEILNCKYRYRAYSQKTIREVVQDREFLKVDHRMPLGCVAKLAAQRPYGRQRNPIVVEDENGYHGIVTMNDLLKAVCGKGKDAISGAVDMWYIYEQYVKNTPV